MGMNCIHITDSRNLNSIKKFGLLPTKSFLHADRMKRSFQTDKVIYLMLLESKSRASKFIKDFIYCKLWIHPRIRFMRKNKVNSRTEEEKVYNYKFELEQKIFSILFINFIPKKKWIETIHEQSNFFGQKDIDERYTHNDKPLVITPEKIKSNQISEIGNAYPYIRNNRIQNIKLEGWQ